jgi:ABC-type branched-subunit amino acid transport system ATPase component
VKRCEVVSVVGANGAGKTSFIRSIAGIDRPQAGRIGFAGQNSE